MNDNIKRERAVEAYIPRSFVCAECGKPVTTEYGHTRTVYCSDECMNKAMKRDCKENRKRQMETAFVEPVWLWKTYERYDGICAICGLPVPHDKSPENQWAATRDHIIPLSKGGLHMNTNCQPAHRLCNSLKLDVTEDFRIDWEEKLKEEPGRWNLQLDDLWEQLNGVDLAERAPSPRV